MATPSVKSTLTTESVFELENEERGVFRTAVENLLCMCQERADIMYSVKETAKKIYCERRDEREAHRAILACSADCKESVWSTSTHSHSSLTCTQTATGQDSTKRARAQAVELRSGDACLFLHGQEHTVSELESCRSRIIRFDN